MSNTLRVIISDAVTGGDDNVAETIVPGTGTYTKSASDNMASQTILPTGLIATFIIITFMVTYIVLARIVKKKALKQSKIKTPDFAIKRIKKVGYEALVLALLLGTGGLLINHSARIDQAKAAGLSITAEDTTITITRNNGVAFAVASTTVTINEATNRGYALYVKTINDANLKLVGGTEQINALVAQDDLTSLALNTYGITTDGNATNETAAWDSILKLDDTTNAHHILTKNSATEANDTATVYFGAYVDTTLPAGTYEGEIEYIATDRPDRSLEQAFIEAGKTRHNGYFAMQDMTSEICENVEMEESELQLIDKRDGKVYWVAKLKDDKCWMTQNLDLDLDTNVTLTHEDTDLGYGEDKDTLSWTPAYSTTKLNEDGETFEPLDLDNNIPQSLDVGDWYYYSESGNDVVPLYYLSSNTLGEDGVRRVFSQFTGSLIMATEPIVDEETGRNGKHGHIGNYYNYLAIAGANSFDDAQTEYTFYENSICPAGWKIITNEGISSLLNIYNVNDGYQMRLNPLYFIPGGFVIESWSSPGVQVINVNGVFGYYAQNFNIKVSGEFSNMYFNTNEVNLSSPYGFRYPCSVRCIAR